MQCFELNDKQIICWCQNLKSIQSVSAYVKHIKKFHSKISENFQFDHTNQLQPSTRTVVVCMVFDMCAHIKAIAYTNASSSNTCMHASLCVYMVISCLFFFSILEWKKKAFIIHNYAHIYMNASCSLFSLSLTFQSSYHNAFTFYEQQGRFSYVCSRSSDNLPRAKNQSHKTTMSNSMS